MIERLRLLQLDSVNVAVRAHYMPVFSRLGPYERALVDDAAWSSSARRPRLLVEYWAHEASLLPVADSAGVDVLNGIAYDSSGDRLFVTGKDWPKLFQIRLVRQR